MAILRLIFNFFRFFKQHRTRLFILLLSVVFINYQVNHSSTFGISPRIREPAGTVSAESNSRKIVASLSENGGKNEGREVTKSITDSKMNLAKKNDSASHLGHSASKTSVDVKILAESPTGNEEQTMESQNITNVTFPKGTDHNFPYMINNETLCSGVDNLTYIIYVHANPRNLRKRLDLRQTWAQNSVIPAYQSRLMFMMGNPHNEKIQEALYDESKLYGDIIQEDFVDSYKNLTHKAIGALKWISTYCNHAKFVFKTDDDIYVDIFRLLNVTRHKVWDSKRFFLGAVYIKDAMPVLRDPKTCSKWCVKESEYKPNFFPRYLPGGFLVMSGDLIKDLYLASKRTPFLWIDDVYLSGLLPLSLKNVTYHDVGQLYKYFESHIFEKSQFDDVNAQKYIATVTPHKRMFWVKTLLTLNEEQIHLIGKEHYSKLITNATKYFQRKIP